MAESNSGMQWTEGAPESNSRVCRGGEAEASIKFGVCSRGVAEASTRTEFVLWEERRKLASNSGYAMGGFNAVKQRHKCKGCNHYFSVQHKSTKSLMKSKT